MPVVSASSGGAYFSTAFVGAISAVATGFGKRHALRGLMPVSPGSSRAGLPLDTDGNLPVTVASGLVPREHDYIGLAYSGSDLTEVTYKQGGANGTVVATLALTYENGVLVGIARA